MMKFGPGGGSPESVIQEMLKPEKKKASGKRTKAGNLKRSVVKKAVKEVALRNKKQNEIKVLKLEFLDLNTRLKRFGRTKCRFCENSMMRCHHPNMAYGGMSRNTACEVGNCPFINN